MSKKKKSRSWVIREISDLATEADQRIRARLAFDKLSKEMQVAIVLRWGDYFSWYCWKENGKKLKRDLRAIAKRIAKLDNRS